MSDFLFGRLSCRIPANDIIPGNRYRRQLGRYLAATATVLDLRSDLVGIPHAQFSLTVDGSVRRLSEGDTRVLAVQSFHEPFAQEAQPDLKAVDSATVVQLLPRQAIAT
jgi:hypothetical protein